MFSIGVFCTLCLGLTCYDDQMLSIDDFIKVINVSRVHLVILVFT
jgi:hypothetical protein